MRTPACIVTPEFPGPMLCGGLGTAVYWQARTLASHGIPVTVFCTGDVTIGTAREWHDRFARDLGIEFIEAASWVARSAPELLARAHFPNHTNLARSLWALRYLERNPFPVVYLQDYLGHGLRPLQAKAAGLAFESTEFALTFHGPTEWALDGLELFATTPEHLVIEFQERECARLADRLVAPSAHIREWVATTWQVDAARIEVVPYCFESASERAAESVHGPFSHLVFFGRLETRKGLELFLDALVGSDVLRRSVDRVTFLGKSGQAAGTSGRLWIEHVLARDRAIAFDVLDGMDTFQAWDWLAKQRGALVVAPSLADNLPFAVIELFGRSVPFVTTSIGGIPEIVGDNPDLLADPTVAALRDRLESIVTSGTLRIRHDTGYDPDAACSRTLAIHREASRRLPVPRSVPAPVTSDEPEISVIVPHFNSSGYLAIALETLADQRGAPPFEVLVVDDASMRGADRSGFAAIATQYASDARFRFFPETTNRGAGGSRNFAAERARGRFFVFFDADNEAYPDLLAVYRRAIETSGADAMTCFLESVTQDDRDAPRRLESRVDLFFTPPGAALEAGAFMNVFGDTCSIVRREAFEAIGGFSAGSPEYRRLPSGDFDWDFFAKLALSGRVLGVVPKALFRYRNSAGNQQNSNARRYYRNRSIILARYAGAGARARLDWRRLLALFEGGGQPAAPAAIGQYEYFTRLSDEGLLAAIGRVAGAPNDTTIARMRARLAPLLQDWRVSRPRVFLYGAGLHTRVLLGAVPELAEHVVGVVDRSATGGGFLGWPCVTPEAFDASRCDVVVYSSKEHESAMHAAFGHHPVRHVLLYS